MSDVLGFPQRLAKTYWDVWKEREECLAALEYNRATSPDDYTYEENYIEYCTNLMGSIRQVLGTDSDYLLDEAREKQSG